MYFFLSIENVSGFRSFFAFFCILESILVEPSLFRGAFDPTGR
jgi:hypothetical protein